ncbi:acetate kinase [Mycoplasma bradburyae]|uniref:acetate kinase n=1 Tax=Mycoplasma bradburyae TaxID=2963128 RepID=UPI0020CCB7CE|nr:acetate kinase [Mycoplasma bradburyae]MDC4182831.1 acetate kinase [Mycoplasma bradburyae]UTS70599.1 acetate kinase [Mycoplasma bradburyae]
MNKILVINAGSSSIKFQLYDASEKVLAKGLCERIFIDGAYKYEFSDGTKEESTAAFPNHKEALSHLLESLKKHKVINDLNEIVGVGHRVVQGAYWKDSTLVTPEVLEQIYDLAKLAPLHNKPEADVIDVVQKLIPSAKNVAVFDTTFHTTMPEVSWAYAIPGEWKDKHLVRRYGYHGTSYRYITKRFEEILNKKSVNLIVCHLGNGASVAAIKGSQSINTTMGFTPLEGLVMGTRSGDIDPSVIQYIAKQTNRTLDEITNDLNKKSGLLGLSGYADMRDVEANLPKTQVAIDLYTQRVADYIVKYANQINEPIDGIVFTAGVGENSATIVQKVMSRVNLLKVSLDSNAFENKYSDYRKISDANSQVDVYQVRTNEEIMIMRDVVRLSK